MNSINKHNIFDNSGNLSKKEIKDYLSGNLSEEEMYSIEKKMMDNDFNSDAIEGYEKNPNALNELNDLSQKFNNKILNKKTSFFKSKGFTIITASTIIIASIAAFIIINNDKPKSSAISQNNKINTIEKSDKRNFDKVAQTIKNEENAIDNAIVIPKEDQITYEDAKINQPKVINTENIIEEDNSADQEKIISINAKEEIVEKDLSLEKEILFKSNFPATYIQDLKVVDYKGFYKSDIRKFHYNTGGVAAKYENAQQQSDNEFIEYEVELIPYAKFLEGALIKFRKNNFKGALKDFNTISNQFNDDQNANFYGGLCYYNIGKPRKAINYFDDAINNSINTFDQEAKWYKALSLIKIRSNKKAKVLLNQIITEGGFYKDQAQKKLEEIE